MADVSHLSSAARLTARREIAMLPRLLNSGEAVAAVCHGSAGGRTGVAIVTNRRLLFMRRRRLWGADVASVPLSQVRTAEERVGIRHAMVTVNAGATTIRLTDVDCGLAERFCARLRAAVRAS